MKRAVRWLIVINIAIPFAGAMAQAKPAVTPPKDTTPPPPLGRVSWTTDRRPLRPGDLLTIVVDEQTAASETSVTTAHANRAQTGSIDSPLAPEKFKSLGIGYGATSDAGAAAGRQGDLTAVLSVRVTSMEPNGIVHVSGQKSVTVDGRKQEIALTGVVRAQDVLPDNTVLSTRVAEAVISYKGKKIGPTTGIIGKILGILWP